MGSEQSDIPPFSVGGESSYRPPRKWKWSTNVLLIGTSQSGKSTLINRFRSLAVNSEALGDPAEVGKGTFACTLQPRIYQFDIPMTSYELIDPSTGYGLQGVDDEEQIFNGGIWSRKGLILAKQNPDADLVRVRLYDTPGLDDSEMGRNVVNIRRVLLYLMQIATESELDLRHISAVFFILKASQPFTASFQHWYHYYRQCMPNLFATLAVVNTAFKLKDWKNEYSKWALSKVWSGERFSSMQGKMEKRREAWASLFDGNATHFFIDSKPFSRNGFEEYASRNKVFELLVFLRSQGKMPIENMHLVKFPEMVKADLKVAGLLADVREQVWTNERDAIIKTLSTQHRSLAMHESNQLMWQNEIDAHSAKIKEWDKDVEFDLGKWSSENASAPPKFQKIDKGMEITETVFPFQVDAPDTDGRKWTSRKQPTENNKTWRGTHKKTGWFSQPPIYARSYTTNKTYYASQIQHADAEIDRLLKLQTETLEVITLQRVQAAQSGVSSEKSPRLEQLTRWLSVSKRLMDNLHDNELRLHKGLASSAQERYGKSIDKVGINDLVAFIEDEHPQLSAGLKIALEELEYKRSRGEADT